MNLFPGMAIYTRRYTVTYRVLPAGYSQATGGTPQPGEVLVETFTGMTGPGGAHAFVDHCRAAGHQIINVGVTLTARDST